MDNFSTQPTIVLSETSRHKNIVSTRSDHLSANMATDSDAVAAPTSTRVPTATFDTIPAEMRIRIYEYVLADPTGKAVTPITLIRHKNRRHELYQYKQYDQKNAAKSFKEHGKYDRETKAYRTPVPGRAALLTVNKKVYAEAIGVLYSVNTLSFRSLAELRDIIPMIGEGVKHFRSIEIMQNGYNPSLAKQVFWLLEKSTSLRTIRLSHRDFCQPVRLYWMRRKSITVTQVAKDTKDLCKTLHEAYQRNNRNWNVLDVVKIDLNEECYSCLYSQENWFRRENPGSVSRDTHNHGQGSMTTTECKCKCSEAEQNNTTLQAQQRAAIAKALGIIEQPRIEEAA